MRNLLFTRKFLGGVIGVALVAAATVAAQQDHSLTLASGRVSLAGSSNIHEWTATTTAVRVTTARLGVTPGDASFLDAIVKAGAFGAFDVAVSANTLKSGKDGLDKNMYKALKTEQFADITLRVQQLQAGKAPGTLRAIGMMKIAGVEREVSFDVTAQPSSGALAIKGELPILMTDYGIAPPKAMLGMLKTSPKVTVTFEAVLTIPPATATITK